MNRKERRQQKKKQQRQQQIRREKHLRQSPPREEQDKLQETGPGGPETPSRSMPTMPVRSNTPQSLPHGPHPDASPVAEPSPGGTTSSTPVGDIGAADAKDAPLDNFFIGNPARKWLDKLLVGTSAMEVVDALDPASYVPEHLMLKASVCCEMLVAAEVAAAGRGHPSRHLPDAVAAWLQE